MPNIKQLLIILIIAVISVILLVNFLVNTEEPGAESETGEINEEPVAFGRSMALFSLDGTQEVGGTDLVEIIEGQIEIKIELTDTSDNIAQPAHIHAGSCDALGTIIFPLNPIVSGSSETTLEISGDDLQAQLPLVVNVHESEDKLDVNVACGLIPIE